MGGTAGADRPPGPAALASADGFLTGEHRLAGRSAAALLDTLDLFGIAHAVVALRDGADPRAGAAVLRRVSGVDAVVGKVTRSAPRCATSGAATPARTWRRWPSRDDDRREFLSRDDTVVAADVGRDRRRRGCRDGGRSRCDDADAHLRRAVAWQRYWRGPV